MSESYEKVLKEWGKRRLLADKPHLSADDVEVTEVDVYECEAMGYCETCYSPAYIDITIRFTVGDELEPDALWLNARDDDGFYSDANEFNTLTGLIRELEALAEKMDRKNQK
jgi:hypothetical protein